MTTMMTIQLTRQLLINQTRLPAAAVFPEPIPWMNYQQSDWYVFAILT